jgi:hypothetical protein
MDFLKNFLIIMTLAAFAYHLDSFGQIRPNLLPQENINRLMFLTANEAGGTDLNRVDAGRSSLISQKFTDGPILAGSISWTNQEKTRLLTYSQKAKDESENESKVESIDLKLAIINTSPSFSIRYFTLPENFKKEYQFNNWIAKTQTQLFAINNDSIYLITLGSLSQIKANLIHQANKENDEVKLNIVAFDAPMENLVFSYNQAINPTKKIFYNYNLKLKKINKLDATSSCAGELIYLNNKLIPMGENNFLMYCSASASARAAFIQLDFTKLTITKYETKEELKVDSDFTVDSAGYYIIIKKANERVLYCNGNIKQILSARCLNTSSMASGYIYSTQIPSQFYIINNRNIFSLDFSTGITRRTSIMFSSPLSGNVLSPISI